MIWILKILIRAALWLFCTEININNKSLLKTSGPLLIIANHPNSFLDAIIIGVQYKRRIYFLARGDVFKKRIYRFLLGLLNMIPVHRQREGREHLHLNEYTFKESVRLLKKEEALLVFIEGTCVNSHELQPFKKGTARILEAAHKQRVHPTIHITGIGYNQFRGIGKKINISIQHFIFNKTILTPKDRVIFNNQVFEILNKNILPSSLPRIIYKNPLYYFHLPYYKLIKYWAHHKTKGTVFFDSVLFGLLLFTYPVFLALVFFILYFIKTPLPIIFITLLGIITISKYTVRT